MKRRELSTDAFRFDQVSVTNLIFIPILYELHGWGHLLAIAGVFSALNA
jgi:hypothetical protein